MLATLLVSVALAQAAPDPFHAYWYSGGAELDGYSLRQPRYGEARHGEAVMVWVTEPFSISKHVKLDHPEEAGANRQDVLKLNFSRQFITGVYEYSLLTSVFVPVAPAGPISAHTPLKETFTGQEWCGNVFTQLTRKGSALDVTGYSYFESEGDHAQQLAMPDRMLTEDELWFRVRELVEPFAPGTYPLLPGLMAQRLSHTPMVLGSVTVSRSERDESLKVNAGTFPVARWTLKLAWGPKGIQQQTRTVWTERAWPHRIIAWEGDQASFQGNEPQAERGELLGSIRDEYWVHHRVMDEGLRLKVGLSGPRK